MKFIRKSHAPEDVSLFISNTSFFHVLPYIKRHFLCLKFNITHLLERLQYFHEVTLKTFNIHAPEVHYKSSFISHYVRHFDETDFVKHSRSKAWWSFNLERLFSDFLPWSFLTWLSSSGEFNILTFHETLHETFLCRCHLSWKFSCKFFEVFFVSWNFDNFFMKVIFDKHFIFFIELLWTYFNFWFVFDV